MADSISILHVDDEPGYAELTRDWLERIDDRFIVTAVERSTAALDRSESGEFDCIVSDYEMPEMDGIEFLQAIRDRDPDLPFILYTGKGSEEIASEAISAGVTDYLQKGQGRSKHRVLANRISNAVARYRSDRELDRHREYMDRMFDAIEDLVFVLDESGTLRRWNDALSSVSGYPDEEIREMSGTDFVPEKDRNRVRATIESVFETGDERIETALVCADGTTVPYEFSGTRVVHPDGTPCLVGIGRDISERIQYRTSLKQLQERTRALMQTETVEETVAIAVDAAHDDLGAPIAGVNMLNSAGTGLEPVEFVDVTDSFPEPPEYSLPSENETAPVSEVVWSVFDSGEPRYIEDANTHAKLSGHTPIGSAVIHPLGNHGVLIVSHRHTSTFSWDDRELLEIIATALKTGLNRVEREERLRDREVKLEQQNAHLSTLASQLEAQYKTLFEETPIMSVLTHHTEQGPVIRDCNRQFHERLAYEKATVIGEPLTKFYSERSVHLLRSEGIDRIRRDERFSDRRELVTSEGEILDTLLKAVPLSSHEGVDDDPGTLGMYIDITDRESRRRASGYLSELVQTASKELEIELKTVQDRLTADHSTVEDEILSALDRMDRILEALQTHGLGDAHPADQRPVPFERIVHYCRRAVSGPVRVEGHTNFEITADEDRLYLLLENLFRVLNNQETSEVMFRTGPLEDGFFVRAPVKKPELVDPSAGHSTNPTDEMELAIARRIAKAHDWDFKVERTDTDELRIEIRSAHVENT